MPDQAELQVIDFVDGNMAQYAELSTEFLGRAVTAREAILCIVDQESDYDKKIYGIAKQVVLDNYNLLVKETNEIPRLDALIAYVDADSTEALYDIGDAYWHLHEANREDRKYYQQLLEQGKIDDAEEYKDEAITSTVDWIMESECSYGFYEYPSYTYISGIMVILCDLELPVVLDNDSDGHVDTDWIPDCIGVIINDAQEALFPQMVGDYTSLLHVDEVHSGVTGLVMRRDVDDALRLEAKTKEAS